MGKTNIGVTGTGSLIGQAIIKSIQRSSLSSSISIIGFDYFPQTVGSFWCEINYILPDILDPKTNESEWIAFICERIRKHKIKLLFVGVDFELPLMAKYKDLIQSETGAIVMVSSEEVISIANDKYLTYSFLKKNGLFYPQSFLPDEIDSFDIKFPVIVKPRKGARSVGVSLVENRNEMLTALEKLKEPIIQEYVGNNETEFTCGTIFLNGELKRTIVLNRTLKAGNTYISHFKKDFPEIIETYLKDVVSILKPFGACNFQLRLDVETGEPKIFEINSRHSGTTYIRSLFGYKEVEYIIQYLLMGVDKQFDLQEGTVVRYYDEFFMPS